MTMPYSAGISWYQYDPAYNAPLTPAELDLFKRLQSGDPILQQSYRDKYGADWYIQWGRDQDYWNARYLNQLASPEEMQRLSQDHLTGAGYPYTIFHLNAIKEMGSNAQAYFSTFVDQNLAGYLASIVGMSLQNIAFAGQGDAGTPTTTMGVQEPTFTPTQVGEIQTVDTAPPTVSGAIPPGPTDNVNGGPTTVPASPESGTVQPTPTGTSGNSIGGSGGGAGGGAGTPVIAPTSAASGFSVDFRNPMLWLAIVGLGIAIILLREK